MWVPGQPELHSETLCQTNKQTNKQNKTTKVSSSFKLTWLFWGGVCVLCRPWVVHTEWVASLSLGGNWHKWVETQGHWKEGRGAQEGENVTPVGSNVLYGERSKFRMQTVKIRIRQWESGHHSQWFYFLNESKIKISQGVLKTRRYEKAPFWIFARFSLWSLSQILLISRASLCALKEKWAGEQ